MHITRVTVEVLETPVDLQYVAAGHSVSSNWHALSRIYTDDGVEGIGFAVATSPSLVKPLAQTAAEFGQGLVGLNVLEIEAARSKLERPGNWVGPGGMISIAIATLDIALWDAPRAKSRTNHYTACWADTATEFAPTLVMPCGTVCPMTFSGSQPNICRARLRQA